MSSTEIIRVPILPFHMVNAHVVRTEGGCVIVDAGIPGSERRFARALAKHGMSFKDVKLIVVTHAHTDHAGSAAQLRELTGAPILAHEYDLDFFRRKRPMTFCPTSGLGKLFYKTPVPHEPYTAFEPDVLMKDGDVLDLKEFGVDGKVRHTPGHTPGHIALELASHDALVGDLIASGILIGGIANLARATRPPFEDDPQQVGRELEKIVSRGAKRFYMGHGGPLDAQEVMRHVGVLSRLERVPALPPRCEGGDAC